MHIDLNIDDKGLYKPVSLRDKPWKTFESIKSGNDSMKSIEKIFDELINNESTEEPYDEPFIKGLNIKFDKWVIDHGIKDPRFSLK